MNLLRGIQNRPTEVSHTLDSCIDEHIQESRQEKVEKMVIIMHASTDLIQISITYGRNKQPQRNHILHVENLNIIWGR